MTNLCSRGLGGSLVDDAAFLEDGPHRVSPHLIEPLVDARRFENNEVGLQLVCDTTDPIPAQQSLRGVRRRSYESFFGCHLRLRARDRERQRQRLHDRRARL